MSWQHLPLMLIAFVGLIYYLILLTDYIGPDEGNYIYMAWQVSEGATPYLDFFDNHSPGVYAVMGAVFSLFGFDLVLPQLLMMAVNISTALFIYLISSRLTKGKWPPGSRASTMPSGIGWPRCASAGSSGRFPRVRRCLPASLCCA